MNIILIHHWCLANAMLRLVQTNKSIINEYEHGIFEQSLSPACLLAYHIIKAQYHNDIDNDKFGGASEVQVALVDVKNVIWAYDYFKELFVKVDEFCVQQNGLIKYDQHNIEAFSHTLATDPSLENHIIHKTG